MEAWSGLREPGRSRRQLHAAQPPPRLRSRHSEGGVCAASARRLPGGQRQRRQEAGVQASSFQGILLALLFVADGRFVLQQLLFIGLKAKVIFNLQPKKKLKG